MSKLLRMSFSEKQVTPSKEEWLKILDGKEIGRTSMNKLIMNYLVTGKYIVFVETIVNYLVINYALEGFKEAAEKFQEESGVGPTVELNSLDDRIHIRDFIMTGRIQEAIARMNHLHPELLDNDRYLYFHLQVINLYHSYYVLIIKN